eukprot:GFUD01034108.1.p1 GENE.GFUD01034108.1~~GFUD01034108.1.p1  ORF type:complete len:229 (-),score=57.67 GFUD01034108.1:222-908(-)
MELFLVFLILSLSTVGSLVIKSHWEHVKFKTLPPARVDARKSGELVLTCSATGSPAPSVSWYKDDMFVAHLDFNMEEESSSLGETISRLRLPCITEEDAGKYECRARAGKHEVSEVTEVKVIDFDQNLCVEEGKPEISMWRPTMMVDVDSSVVVLPCRVKHPHDHQISWTNGRGDGVGNDVRFVVRDNGDLVISSVTWSDMGQYTCTATNMQGTSSVQTFLYPLAQGN